MTERAPTSGQGGKKKRGRPRGKPLSARELAARRKNLERARRAPRELIYRPTERRMAASQRNLRKMLKARRSREGRRRIRLNALKHGLYARLLTADSVERLGESSRDYRRHLELFARLLVPRDAEEAAMVQELADLSWRRLRLLCAEAVREARAFRRTLELHAHPGPLDAEETELRGYELLAAFDNPERVLADASKIRVELEDLLRMLVRKRSAGAGIQESEARDESLGLGTSDSEMEEILNDEL